MRMPFGKYKDHNLDALPDDYLRWVIANIPLREPLWSAITEEMALRGYEELPPPPAPPPPPLTQSRETEEGGAWTMGGDPQEIIAGDFPLSSRQRPEA
jgi:Putative quorum-sensing-regulated virulence factor